MAKVIAEVSFSPIGTGTTSLSKYVTAALAVLQMHPEVRYQLNPMGTVLEGERRAIIDVIEEMNEAIFLVGAKRVGTTIKMDDRRDTEASMEHKVEVVREGLRDGQA
ncbi:MAG TPA: MTH1187 family thiamine-binding protein [Chloroflexia bacterium]|nr:MTH1187 family thiamine-binding protein [Chloroflexia bacterium]